LVSVLQSFFEICIGIGIGNTFCRVYIGIGIANILNSIVNNPAIHAPRTTLSDYIFATKACIDNR